MVARTSSTTVAALRFTNVPDLADVKASFPLPLSAEQPPPELVRWAYADIRDVVQAHINALEAETIEGFEAFVIAQPSSRFAEPTAELVRRYLGEGVELRGRLQSEDGGVGSVLSTRKAETMLGWRPRYDWRRPKL